VGTSSSLGEEFVVLDGYQVNLTQLEDYTQALVETQLLYDQIEDQLTEGTRARRATSPRPAAHFSRPTRASTRRSTH
jgi:hypothetical protein